MQWAMLLQDLRPLLQYLVDIITHQIMTRLIVVALSFGARRRVRLIPNLKITFKNFVMGITKLLHLHRQPNLKYVLKTSAYILVTVESACILTAETVDLIFYQYSILLVHSSKHLSSWCVYSGCTRSV